MAKISARSDEVKGRLSDVQSCDLDEKLVFENNNKQVWDQPELFKTFLWTNFHIKSTEHIKNIFLVIAAYGHSIAIERQS